MIDLENLLHLRNTELAEEFGVTVATIKKWLIKQGLPTNRFSKSENALYVHSRYSDIENSERNEKIRLTVDRKFRPENYRK